MKHHIGRLGFGAFYIAALAVSGWFLVAKLDRAAQDEEAQRLAALTSIRGELTQSMRKAQSFVELLQLTMNNELAERPKAARPSRLLSAIRQDSDGNYNMDELPDGISRQETGNLTGHGPLNIADPDLAFELETALSLRSIFRQILTELPNAAWTYYVSARHFEHVFPFRLSGEFSYKEKDLEQEYFVRGTPELNPSRAPYVTDVYDDDFGQGLMISLGRPVYTADQLRGIVALDFTLSYIDGVLASFPKVYGELYLIDAEKRVIGYSNRITPEQHVDLPALAASSPLLAPDQIGDRAATTSSDNSMLAVQGLSVLPFALVTVMPTSGFYGQVARGASVEILTFVAVLVLLAIIEWRRRLAGALARAKEEAENAARAKSSFLAMMSHEIRTPMNGVMSMAEMIEQTELSEDQRSMSSVIRESAAALLTIINDILDFSKIEAGKLDIEAMPFSLVDVAESAGELVCQRAEEKGLVLAVVIDPAVPEMVVGNPTRIRQVLINLLGNGVKFTEHGSVTLRVLAVGSGAVRFEIADTGIGLTPEQQGRLFRAFAQADVSTSRRYGGTGLGLSISRRLCQLMRGRIGVQSKAGAGSCFWVELPLPPAPHTSVDRGEAGVVNIADAKVLAVGFDGPTREAFDLILLAAGIRQCVHITIEDDVVSRVLAEEGVVFFSSHESDLRALMIGHEVASQAEVNGQKVAMILAAQRSLASTLSESDRAGFLAAVTLPLRRTRLRHVIAAALGRANLAERAVGASDFRFDPPPVEEARAAGALILVAEDNATNQIVIGRMLGKLGYAMELADNGREALELFQPGVHGLLLTDFHMPVMDGFELTAEIRRRENSTNRRVPIVALTADALPGTEQRCLDAGMDGYLTKPIESKLLAAVLEKWLPQASQLRRPQRSSKA